MLCLLEAPAPADTCCSSTRDPFSLEMSCLITSVSSLISSAGSSNMLVRFASCARRASLLLVLWIPAPILAARFANSELCAGVIVAGRPPAPAPARGAGAAAPAPAPDGPAP